MESSQIKARTKWKQVYPLFSTDVRYLNMLGIPGSNPLELFWDVVDSLDQKLDAKIAIAEAAIRRHNKTLQAQRPDADKSESKEDEAKEDSVKLFQVEPETTEEEFLAVVKADQDESVATLVKEDWREIFETVCILVVLPSREYQFQTHSPRQLHAQALKQRTDEKRRAERRIRHLQDDLRYALKKVPESFDYNMSYEEVSRLKLFLSSFLRCCSVSYVIHCRRFHICKNCLSTRLSKTTKPDEPPSPNLSSGRKCVVLLSVL